MQPVNYSWRDPVKIPARREVLKVPLHQALVTAPSSSPRSPHVADLQPGHLQRTSPGQLLTAWSTFTPSLWCWSCPGCRAGCSDSPDFWSDMDRIRENYSPVPSDMLGEWLFTPRSGEDQKTQQRAAEGKQGRSQESYSHHSRVCTSAGDCLGCLQNCKSLRSRAGCASRTFGFADVLSYSKQVTSPLCTSLAWHKTHQQSTACHRTRSCGSGRGFLYVRSPYVV